MNIREDLRRYLIETHQVTQTRRYKWLCTILVALSLVSALHVFEPEYWQMRRVRRHIEEISPQWDAFKRANPGFEAVELFPRYDEACDSVGFRSFPLSHDLEDGFFCSAWRYPERYLDPVFRRGISHFQLADPVPVQGMVEKLRQDIVSGVWDKNHGNLRNIRSLDCGHFFVSAEKAGHPKRKARG